MAVFTVSLSNASYQTVTVDYSTADLTALLGDSDYTAASGTVTFLPDVTQQMINVQTTADTKFELDDQFEVNLSNAVNATTIGDAQGIGTILNDDVQPTIMISDASITEGGSGRVHGFALECQLPDGDGRLLDRRPDGPAGR